MALNIKLLPSGCGVYCIRNTTNSKLYIGSSTNIQKRCRKHAGLLRNNKHDNQHLQAAFNKYGEDAFETEVLATVIVPQKLRNVEQSLMERYHACDRNFGYNKSSTTATSTITEEGKNTLRLKNLGKTYSQEVNAKKGLKGKSNPFFGQHHSRANLEKMVISKGYQVSPFVCLETGNVYTFFQEAANATGGRMATISECVKHGRFHVSNGLHFMYVHEIPFPITKTNDKIDFTPEQQSVLIQQIDPRRKLFKCLETNEYFTSVKKAAKQFGIRRASLSDQLSGKRKSSINGYHFSHI